MKLVIAEKPILARDIARAICGIKVSETASLPITGNGYTVVAAAGHLLELCAPDDIKTEWSTPWNVDVLPIYIPVWPKKVIKGKEKLVANIKVLLGRCDSVINAGDPDDEGQLIVDEILDYLGYNGYVERVYVNDNIEKNIVKAFENLVPNDKCRAAGDAALARSIADYCFGVNETRLASIKCNKKVSVGRVQTPTLGLVVNRDLNIINHKTQKYYESEAVVKTDNFKANFKFKPSKDILQEEKHLYTKDIPNRLSDYIQGKEIEFKTSIGRESNYAPLPYNLTKLISDMSKKYGYSATQIQDTTQALRDKYKAITYNRTDCQYLKEEHFSAAAKVLDIAMTNIGVSWQLDYTIKSKAFNDKNVTAHHGIIPQEIKVDISKLSEIEKNIYTSIVKRYAMQFLPTEIAEVSTSVFSTEYGEFECKCRKVLDKGWKNIFSEDKEDSDVNNDLWIEDGNHKGTVSEVIIEEKETSAPKPYTEGTLIADMSSIAKYVTDQNIKEILKRKDNGKKGENGSIGTTATRSSIIESLKSKGFLKTEKGKIRSTALGREFYNILPDEIKKADTTALWWLMQEDIAEGRKEINAIQDSVVKVFNAHKEDAYTNANLKDVDINVIGKCPLCGSAVIEINNKKMQAYKCENKSCSFILWKKQFGTTLSSAQAAKILLQGKTAPMNFKSKAGKAYKARLKLKSDKSGLELDFVNKY